MALENEEARIAAQEAIWDAVPDGPEKQALQAAMLERALELMFEGDGTQADAITEWLPKADVLKMYDRWEAECFPPTPDHSATGDAEHPEQPQTPQSHDSTEGSTA